jgi:torulene dioxygenase
MSVEEVIWPNDTGFDTDYQEPEPVKLTVKGTIPSYAAGVLCENAPTKLEPGIMLTAP